MNPETLSNPEKKKTEKIIDVFSDRSGEITMLLNEILNKNGSPSIEELHQNGYLESLDRDTAKEIIFLTKSLHFESNSNNKKKIIESIASLLDV